MSRQDLCTCPKDVLTHRKGCPAVPFRLPDEQRRALERLKLAGGLEAAVRTATEFEDALADVEAAVDDLPEYADDEYNGRIPGR